MEALVRRMYEAWNRRDLDGTLGCLHPDIELHLAIETVEPVTGGSRRELRGHEGVRKFFQLLADSWDQVRIDVHEVIEGSHGHLICFETWTVRGRQGIEVDTELVDVYGFRDGLIASGHGFRDKNEALEAFGPVK